MSRNAGCIEREIPCAATQETVRLAAMYPTGATERETSFGKLTEHVAMDAPLAEGKFRLVVVSHGTGSSHLLFRKLGAHLARHGFIAVLVEHPRNNRNNNELANTHTILENRPKHISAVIDWAFAEWSESLEPDKVGIVGHSLGGYTALALAGGAPRSHPDMSPMGDAPALAVTPDSRVKSAVLLAPATPWFFTPGSLTKVDVPVLMYTGEKDIHLTPWHAEIVKNGLPDVSLLTHIEVPNAGHYSFLGPYPAAMISPSFPPSQDPEGFNREEFHGRMNAEIVTFLNRAMPV